jgi:hypothetical protein
VDLPELRQWGAQLEVAAEAFEARLVGEALRHIVHELLDGLCAWISELEPAAAATFLATDVDAEDGHQKIISTE